MIGRAWDRELQPVNLSAADSVPFLDRSCSASPVLARSRTKLTTAPWTHIAYSTAFGAIGYWYYFVEQNR